MALKSAASVKAQVTGGIPPQWKGVVTFRIKEAKFGPSASSGLPMITLTTEVVTPTEVTSDVDSKTYDITGKDMDWFLMLNEVDSKGQPSNNLFDVVNNLLPLLGLKPEIDDENPLFDAVKNPSGINFIGICFDALVSTMQRTEQRKLPNGQYVPVMVDGKPLVRGWEWNRQARDILRKVDASGLQVSNKPF